MIMVTMATAGDQFRNLNNTTITIFLAFQNLLVQEGQRFTCFQINCYITCGNHTFSKSPKYAIQATSFLINIKISTNI